MGPAQWTFDLQQLIPGSSGSSSSSSMFSVSYRSVIHLNRSTDIAKEHAVTLPSDPVSNVIRPESPRITNVLSDTAKSSVFSVSFDSCAMSLPPSRVSVTVGEAGVQSRRLDRCREPSDQPASIPNRRKEWLQRRRQSFASRTRCAGKPAVRRMC